MPAVVLIGASAVWAPRPARVSAGGASVGEYSSAIVYNGQAQDFYYDSTNTLLGHAWYSGGWHTETLDGAGGSNGAETASVGTDNSAVIYNGQLQDFYRDTTHGTLRHAVWTGSSWFFESLDGPSVTGGNGRTGDSVGQYNSAVIYNGQLQDFYFDLSNGLMRHAVWTGSGWFFESLDGPSVSGGNGRTSNFVGGYNDAVIYHGQLQDFYYDSSTSLLRHAVWIGSTWFFESLDGTGVGGGNGRIGDSVGQFNSAVIYSGQLQDFYYDSSNDLLRHAVWTGSTWFFESLDGTGAGGGNGRTTDGVGSNDSAVIYNTQLQDFYFDGTNGSLRHATYAAGWFFETIA
ncbi:MAG: hypothetical protein JOY80_07275 [Candidatus Dormibacteraeota bacterium]|nr:hypothetical protein [Candidatus Dormibacteraeota bacterium]